MIWALVALSAIVFLLVWIIYQAGRENAVIQADFDRLMKERERESKANSIVATHPDPDDAVNRLREGKFGEP